MYTHAHGGGISANAYADAVAKPHLSESAVRQLRSRKVRPQSRLCVFAVGGRLVDESGSSPLIPSDAGAVPGSLAEQSSWSCSAVSVPASVRWRPIGGGTDCRSPSSRCVRDQAAGRERTVLGRGGARTALVRVRRQAHLLGRHRREALLECSEMLSMALGRPEARRHAASQRRSRRTLGSVC